MCNMGYQEHKAKLMQDPEFRKAYEALEPEYQCRREEARLRVKHQTDLARALGLTVEQLVEELTSLWKS